jgi:sterol desaturase/sphingolipid hydroxylase (fatty acid hydroxylase superfamily)
MNIYTIMQHRYGQFNRQVICYWIFLMPASLLLVLANFFRPVSVAFSQAALFLLGWISWTFAEYIAHRFWMHNRPETGKTRKITNHQYHHTHPTELKVKDAHRIMLIIPGMLIMLYAMLRLNYFTIFAGFYAGFLSYQFMHVILHRKWAHAVFPRLTQHHILHHCKFSNKCFGVTVTWWDVVFNTSAPKHYKVPEKIINYYFGETWKNNPQKTTEANVLNQTFYKN